MGPSEEIPAPVTLNTIHCRTSKIYISSFVFSKMSNSTATPFSTISKISNSTDSDLFSTIGEMSNSTGTDSGLFSTVHSSVHLVLFLFITLPSIILVAVCIVALLMAKTIKLKMKVTIINIFAAETIASLGLAVLYIGYPIRVTGNDASAISCRIGAALIAIGFNADLLAIALYAVAVYIFMKYNIRKLKWYVIVTVITTSWVICFIMGVVVGSTMDAAVDNGFCVPSDQTVATESSAFLAINALLMLGCVTVLITLVILILYHARQNIADGNTRTKRAITKILWYHSAKTFVFLLQYALTGILPFSQSHLDSFTAVLAIKYIIDLLYNLTSLLTPIVSLVFLQPLRNALQEECPCCNQNTVHTAPTMVAEANCEEPVLPRAEGPVLVAEANSEEPALPRAEGPVLVAEENSEEPALVVQEKDEELVAEDTL